MIRTCPKCGDYYADELLAFCLADGTPLQTVAPHSERWREGSRVIEARERVLRERKRRLKWRRVLLRAATMLIVTMVVSVVAVNGLLYLDPQPEEVFENKPALVTTPVASLIPSTRGKPGPARTLGPAPSPTPSPTPRVVQVKTTPAQDTKPEPSPTPKLSPEPSPSPVPLPACSEADKSLALKSLINRFGDKWRRSIEGERRRVIAESVPVGADTAEATLGAVEYDGAFLRGCAAVVVTARYAWQVRANPNGTVKVSSVPKRKRFTCAKTLGVWLCS